MGPVTVVQPLATTSRAALLGRGPAPAALRPLCVRGDLLCRAVQSSAVQCGILCIVVECGLAILYFPISLTVWKFGGSVGPC